MMKPLLVTLFLCCSSLLAFGQAPQIDSVSLSGLPLQVYLQSHTGIPIIVQQYSFVGLDKAKGDSLWSVERRATAGLTQKFSDDYDDVVDYVDIENTPFVFIRGVMLDVRNGKVLIGDDEEIRFFRSSRMIPERDLILLELTGKGMIRLYGFHPETGERKFAIDLRDVSGLAQAAAGNQDRSEVNLDPVIYDDGLMLYNDASHLALIDLNKGEMLWNEKLFPGKVERVDDDKLLIFEKKRGLGLSGSLSNNSGLSKEMHLIDFKTGKALWKKGIKLDGNVRFTQDYDGGFIVAHDDGINIYDYRADSEGRWKKDFKQNGVYKVEAQDDGLMVYFKAKRMLLDPKNGDEKWKKEEKVGRPPYEPRSKESFDFTFAGKEASMTNGSPLTIGDQKLYFSRIAFDEERKRIATARLVSEKANLKKETYVYNFAVHDIENGTEKAKEITVPYGIERIEVNDEGQFVLYSDFGLKIMDVKAGVLTEIESDHYTKIQRKGGKTAKRLNRLLGGEEEEETIPGNLTYDYRIQDMLQNKTFDPAAYSKIKMRHTPIIGHRKLASSKVTLPYMSIFNKNTGQAVLHFLLKYDNSNFTVDENRGWIYFIDGETVRWYSFE